MGQARHLRYGVSDVTNELVRRHGLEQTETREGDSRHIVRLGRPGGKVVQLESLKVMVRRYLKHEYHKENYSLSEAEFVYLLFNDFDFKIKVLKLFELDDEVRKAEQDRDRAKKTIADKRYHFESNAPAEWLAAIREMESQQSRDHTDENEAAPDAFHVTVSPEDWKGPDQWERDYNAARDAFHAAETPEDREKREEWEREHENEITQLNSLSENEELSFMIRAIFHNTVGRAFDLEGFRNDYANRRRLRAMMQYPGEGPEWELLAENYNDLTNKVDMTLTGRDLSAYTDSREDSNNG